MGLIHWWPLRGDLYDRAGNTSLTCSSTTYESGKVGQALVLSGCDAQVANPFIGLDNWSVAFWFKDNGSNDWSNFICFSDNLQRMEVHSTNANWTWYSTGTASGKLFNSGTRISTGNTTGVWHHICIVKNGVNTVLYRNGESLLTHNSAVNFTSESAVMHFNSRANTSYGRMSLSDIRCYDHALSPAEVMELKRGLLIHYNFETLSGNVNLISNPNAWDTTYSCDASGTDTRGTYTVQSDGSVLVVDNVSNTRFMCKQYPAVTAGDVLTVSIKYKNVTGDQTFRWQFTELNSSDSRTTSYWSTSLQKEKEIGDGWKIIYHTITIQNSNTTKIRFWLQDGADYTKYTHSYYLKDFKVEVGETDNPIFDATGYSKEYDCSGHEYHATVNSVDIRDGAATGVHSAYFLNGEQWLEHTGAAFDVSTLSVSLWWRSNCTAAKTGYHIPFAIDSGRVEISIPNNGQLRWGGYINGSRQCNNVTCKDANGGTFSLNNGEWHHIVSVFDGTGFLGYVDGVYQGKQGGSGTISYSGKTLRVGKYNSPASSDYGATNAYISDVKVYNTALTQADITSLYNHTVKVTPDQVMIGNYFIEKGDQENVTYFTTSDFTQGGWSGSVIIDGNEVVLTATNGWRGFVLNTPLRFIGKNGVLSFEYCFTDKTNWDPGSGAWIHTTPKTAQYLIGSGPKLYDIPVGEWKSISLPLTNLTDYFGWTLRGLQNADGASIVMRLRNVRLLVDTKVIQILPTGIVSCNGINQIENVRIEQHGLLTASEIIEQ